jgi:choline dehydrogenase-like flavoprotein
VQEQRARVVVVSATAVESARLLLNSVSPAHRDGLANASGLVGRHLTFSTLGKAWAEWPNAALPPDLRAKSRIHFLNRSVQDLYRIPARKGAYDKGGTLSFLLPHRNPSHTAERLARRASPPLWGQALKDAVVRSLTGQQELEVEVFAEFLPTPATRVTVDPAVKDRWGVPSARIAVVRHAEDAVNCKHLVDTALAIFDAAGAGRTAAETVGGTTYILQHGTCRFGNDGRTSVLRPDCRAWSCPNLYVVDGSFMPTSGGVPTTWTILANAFRVAETLVRRFKAREL